MTGNNSIEPMKCPADGAPTVYVFKGAGYCSTCKMLIVLGDDIVIKPTFEGTRVYQHLI